jgi:hypothetical protein
VIRPLTAQLVQCADLDQMPSMACCVDFGLDGPNAQEKFGALQYAINEGLVTAEELDEALGDGEALTAIARRGENPYKDVLFHTAWDEIAPEREEDLAEFLGVEKGDDK